MVYSTVSSSNIIEEQSNQEAVSSVMAKVPLSVIILTKNEEKFIERCIRSIPWADEKLVIDSGSADRTREIAASLGANVYEQEWLGWSAQRNKGISLAKNDWVFILEADEIVTPELAQSIKHTISNSPDPQNGYSVDRRGDFHGILLSNIERASNRRSFIRLFNRCYSNYDLTTKVHENVLFPGKAVPLQGILIHWRGYSIDELIAVFNRYATVEAEMLHERGCRANGLILFLRPILRFLWCYFAKGGFSQGTRGLSHAMIKATSEYIRYAKLWEMQNETGTIHPPLDIYQEASDRERTYQAEASMNS